MRLSLLSTWIMVLTGVGGAVAAPAPAEQTPVVVVSAVFGPAKSIRPIDFTVRLAQSCGAGVDDCQAFCTRAAVGYPAGERALFIPPRQVCRVTYRCGARLTKVAEADENDTLILSCRP